MQPASLRKKCPFQGALFLEVEGMNEWKVIRSSRPEVFCKKGWLSLFLFGLFYVFCSWKGFRVRKVVMGNIFAGVKGFYIFTSISIIRFERRFIA